MISKADSPNMLTAALAYIAEGFKVFPVKPDKKPLTEHGLKDCTKLPGKAKEYWGKWPNAGIALVTDGFVVMDFDAKNGGLQSKTALEARFGPLPPTRTHRTGGGGEHWIYRNPNGTNLRNTVKLGGYSGVDLRANGGYIVVPPSLHESGSRYEVLNHGEIAPAPAWLVTMASKQTKTLSADRHSGPIAEGERNATLTRMAGAMRGQGADQSAIEAALLEVNRLRCQPPLPEAEVREVARSVARYSPNGNNVCMYILNGTESSEAKRDKNGTENGTTSLTGDSGELSRLEGLAKRIRLWVKDTVGWWTTEEIDRDLGILGQKDKENRRKILLRLRADNIVEAHPKINKQFRYLNTKVTSLAYKTAGKAGVLPVKWPLGIEKYVNLFPGNIAVIAGSPNAGKTALLLNFIYLNQNAFPINYFCSEMGSVELRDRLDEFTGMDINDWKFNAFERAGDFADVIRQDCVNVIDYLEMTEELYRVNTHLTDISHKLGTGLAIVALQKKEGAKYGRGQEFGLEKPKLYLALDKGKVQIVKGKSWAAKNMDPNGLQVSFKIVGGCQFNQTGQWSHPNQ